MRRAGMRTFIFLSVVFIATCAVVYFVSSAVVMTEETFWISLIWLAGFGFLFFNVAYVFLLSVIHPFLKMPVLKEVYVKHFPDIALVYPIRNEAHGIYERVAYSLRGNKLPHLDLWVLSDSDESYLDREKSLITKLRDEFGSRVHYRRRIHPVERKQGNLAEFIHVHPEYAYLYIADADSMVPKGTILKLLRKAAHPGNQDIAIFQCLVKITHATTWYARFERIGADFAQRMNFFAIQAIFGRSISFGHHQLARTKLISRIKLPRGLLSHDNWDTVILDHMGYRVVFCPDVYGYDEAPANYLEAKVRSRRWAQGTLQGMPLLFKGKVSLASRFLAFYGIYLYLADIVFFGWVILGLLSHSFLTGELIHFVIDSLWMGQLANGVLKWTLLFSLAVVFFHKIVILRTWRDIGAYLYELLMSTLIMLNNFVYGPLDILSIPLRKLNWQPMKKDPFARVGFKSAARYLWLGTAFGLFGFYFCMFKTPYFVWQITPILISLIFSIPTAYLTARVIPRRWRGWI